MEGGIFKLYLIHFNIIVCFSCHGSSESTCEECGNKFNSAARLAQHKTQVHASSKTCSACNKEFKHMSNLIRHMKQFHKEKNMGTCIYCTKTMRKDHLSNHMKSCKSRANSNIYNILENSECLLIDTGKDEESMENNDTGKDEESMENNENIRRLNCPHCSGTFITVEKMMKHLKNSHEMVNGETTSFSCS